MKMKVITLKIALYDYDENDNIIPFDDETAQKCYDDILGNYDDVGGYIITNAYIKDEEIDTTNW